MPPAPIRKHQNKFPLTYKHQSSSLTSIHKHLDPFPLTHELWSSVTITNPPIHKWLTPAPICLFVGLSAWVCLCVGVFVFVFVCIWGKRRSGEKLVCFAQRKERKKGAKCEINKIMVYTSYSNRAYMHGYYSKCVNIHSFRRTDVNYFLGKMCKICYFLYFVNVYIHWYECSKKWILKLYV